MYNFYKEFIGYFSAAYVRGEDTGNGTDLPQIAPLNGRFGVKAGVTRYFVVDLSAIVFDAQDKVAAGEYKTPGYATIDLAVNSTTFNMKYGTLQFFGGIQNILDKDYRNHLATNRGSVTIEPGRNFYFRMSVGF